MKSTDINITININGSNNKVSFGGAFSMPKSIVLVLLVLVILAVLAMCYFYPEKTGLLIRWIFNLFLR